MRAKLPSTLEKAKGMTKDYKHTKMELTKAVIQTTKLENIHMKYQKAVDANKRSGHGRVVLIFYELCEKIVGGSPATTQIQGVESTNLMKDGSNNASTEIWEPQSEDQLKSQLTTLVLWR